MGLSRCRLCTGLATFATDYQCNSTAPLHTRVACTKTTPWKSSIVRRPYAGDLGSGPFTGPSAMNLLRKSGAELQMAPGPSLAPFFDYCQRGQNFSSYDYNCQNQSETCFGCAHGWTRHQVWMQDKNSIFARRKAIVGHHGLRGMGVFLADYMGAQDTAAPLWTALSAGPATAKVRAY